MTDKPLEEQSTMSRAVALFRTGGDVLLPSVMQSNDTGQPVLGMTFCINRRKDISRLAGNSVITASYDDLRTEPLIIQKV